MARLSDKKTNSTSKSIVTNPSGNKVNVLRDKCRNHYRNSYRKYNEYFLKCVEEIEGIQPNAFACIQVMRYFIVGILPQYCVIPDPLTKKQRARVEKILEE